MRLLYIEDHPPARLLMTAIITDLGNGEHTLMLAANGGEAIVTVRATPPDLYLIDFDLPDTDGVRLAQRLREIHTAPVILVSAYGAAIQRDSHRGIITMYLPKPLDPDEVLACIASVIDKN
jgi:two-component system response regulator BaeR